MHRSDTRKLKNLHDNVCQISSMIQLNVLKMFLKMWSCHDFGVTEQNKTIGTIIANSNICAGQIWGGLSHSDHKKYKENQKCTYETTEPIT